MLRMYWCDCNLKCIVAFICEWLLQYFPPFSTILPTSGVMFLPWIVLDSLNICEIYNRDKRSLEDIIVSPSIRTQVHGFAENEEVLKMQSWHRIRHCSMNVADVSWYKTLLCYNCRAFHVT